MITYEALRVYDKYGGNDDLFSRHAPPRERQIMALAWLEIDALVQDILAVRSGHAAASFVARLESKIASDVEGEEAKALLLQIAGKAGDRLRAWKQNADHEGGSGKGCVVVLFAIIAAVAPALVWLLALQPNK